MYLGMGIAWLNLFVALLGSASVGRGEDRVATAHPPGAVENAGFRRSFTLGFETKYPENFSNFKYANPNAPKGGTIKFALTRLSPYNSLNPCLPEPAIQAPGVRNLFETLMTSPADDPFSVYPRVASGLETEPGCKAVTFTIDERATWTDPKDGPCPENSPSSLPARRPITASDVAFSYVMVKRHCRAGVQGAFNAVEAVEILDNRHVRFRLKPDQCKQAIMTLARGMLIYSRADFVGEQPPPPQNPISEQRALNSQSPLPGEDEFKGKNPDRIPVGSGPYVVDSLAKEKVVYRRACHYWGKTIPFARGRYNFDRLEYTTFKDSLSTETAILRNESDLLGVQPQKWPIQNDRKVEALLKNGDLTAHEIKFFGAETVHGIAINSEHHELRDPRVRRALSVAFPSEDVAYIRDGNNSVPGTTYFPGVDTRLAPDEDVDRVLSDLRSKYGNAVGNYKPMVPPEQKSGIPGNVWRTRAQEAIRLMKEAGWKITTDNSGGDRLPFSWEKDGRRFPTLKYRTSVGWEADDLIFADRLRKIGFNIDLALINDMAIDKIKKDGNFDLMRHSFFHNDYPDTALASNWSTRAAGEQNKGNNIARIKNPAVDDLIDRLNSAKSDKEVQTYTRAIDYVLQADSPIVLTTQLKWTEMFLLRNKFEHNIPLPKSGHSPYWDVDISSWWEKK